MRLRNAAVAAVLAGASLAGVAAAVAPAVAGVPAVVRQAVTVTTIDRAGKQVPTQVQLQNLTTGTTYNLTSGKASRVPDGTYNVGADITTPGKTSSDTFADRQITVSKPVAVRFDARQGHLVRFTVNDPRATTNGMRLVFASPFALYGGYVGSGGAATYVVPGKLPPGWNFYVMANLSSVTATRSPVEYALIRVVKGRIPSAPAWYSSTAKLATVHVTMRRLNPGDSAFVELMPSGPSDGTYFPLGLASTAFYGPTPYTVQFRLTAGYSWQQQGSYGEELLDNLPVWGAHQYYETFGAATFSPGWGAEVQVSVYGNTLTFGTFASQWMLVDPAAAAEGDTNSSGIPASETAALYHGSKLIGSSADGTGTATIPAATRWYREHVVAQPESGSMFGTVTLDYSFPAAAQPAHTFYSPDEVVPVIRPSGLNADNAARPGTKTTVPIWLTPNPATGSRVHSFQVWASGNSGKTWLALRPTDRNGRWTVVVTNPKKAGYVSLRVRVSLDSGITTMVTIRNAYAIS
jgi:hypothetical protein